MNEYVLKIDHGDSISIPFYIEQDRIMEIGDKMNMLNDMAYMNGHNWGAFIQRYLEVNHPDVLEGMDTDPEAGMYAAYYAPSPGNDAKADKLVTIIKGLIENEQSIYDFMETEGENIEWD